MSSVPFRILASFALGAAGGAGAALAAFGRSAFEPGEPAFESLALALLCAAVAACVRAEQRTAALTLTTGYAFLRLGFGDGAAGVGALAIGLGAYAAVAVFDELGRIGVRFGKFLILGPLLGGVCVAVAPLTIYLAAGHQDSLRPLMLHLFMGVVVGDGVGLGVELAELKRWGKTAVANVTIVRAAEPTIKLSE